MANPCVHASKCGAAADSRATATSAHDPGCLRLWLSLQSPVPWPRRIQACVPAGIHPDRHLPAPALQCLVERYSRTAMPLICLACARVKVDTGRIRSAIRFRTGEWVFSLPPGSSRIFPWRSSQNAIANQVLLLQIVDIVLAMLRVLTSPIGS